MTTYKVVNYDSWVVHCAQARREDIAKVLPPEDVTPENWHYWRTVCGKDLIGRTTDDPVSCGSCIRSFEAAQRTYAELAQRFGVENR